MLKMAHLALILFGLVFCASNLCSAEEESSGESNDKRSYFFQDWNRAQSGPQRNKFQGYQRPQYRPPSSSQYSQPLRQPPSRENDYLRPSGDFGMNVNNLTSAVNFPPNPPSSSPSPKMLTSFNPCEKDCHKIPDDYPVCGTDKKTYINVTHLKCAQTCGKRVKTAYTGRCRNAPTPTGMYISPGRALALDGINRRK